MSGWVHLPECYPDAMEGSKSGPGARAMPRSARPNGSGLAGRDDRPVRLPAGGDPQPGPIVHDAAARRRAESYPSPSLKTVTTS